MKIADFGLSRSLAITREANKRGSMTDLASLAKRVCCAEHLCLGGEPSTAAQLSRPGQ